MQNAKTALQYKNNFSMSINQSIKQSLNHLVMYSAKAVHDAWCIELIVGVKANWPPTTVCTLSLQWFVSTILRLQILSWWLFQTHVAAEVILHCAGTGQVSDADAEASQRLIWSDMINIF